jgi:methyl-accepting chemotaxis protein
MPNLSVGAGLVFRQSLFLVLILTMGAAAYFQTVSVRDLTAAAAATVDHARMAATIRAANEAAGSLSFYLLIGTIFSAVLIAGVSVPTMNRTLAAPIRRIARQMTDLADGDTQIDVQETDRSDEIGDISRALVVLRDAVRANNDMAEEIKARDDREARLRREAAIREKVEHYSA